ncbi:MAG: malto-oligosyltrehalose trehalohydrolase [Acidobacteriia bacterium]|nr:malto-oligosyltrehalose trehalohydrolase [Terriglobia bacterium]
MTEIRVWAPVPKQVELFVDDHRLPMHRDPNGWWRAVTGATEYSFILDGGDPLPDPRSAWQPHGVHGPSGVVEHSQFRWTDRQFQAKPLSSAVIYELHIGTFTPDGTFDSAIFRLDHLASLGITHVELMPVQEFSGDWGWGYDCVDLFAPHHAYGPPDALKRLVDAAHARGLAVLLDVVYNHLGPVGNYLARFGPYFTKTYSTPWGPAVNLDNADSDEVRRFLCDNALMWLRDYHFDGLRLDAIHAIHDSSATHFLEQLSEEVRRLEAQLGRHLLLIAESDLNDPRVVTPREAGGYGIDAQWSDDFHHALHAVLTGERSGYYSDFGTLADLAKSLTNVFVYDGRYSCFRRRSHGRAPGNLSRRRFLGYLQNHDQIGNRAQGERSSVLMNAARLKIGAALVFTAPFVPLIFEGEEFAASTPFQYFTNHHDPDVARAVTEGRRREFAAFGWDPAKIPDPQDLSAFLRSKLDWSELDSHHDILAWYRQLIAVRPLIDHGEPPSVEFNEQDQWLILKRGRSQTICNVSRCAQKIPVPKRYEILLASAQHSPVDAEIELPPESVVVLQEIFS